MKLIFFIIVTVSVVGFIYSANEAEESENLLKSTEEHSTRIIDQASTYYYYYYSYG